MLKHVPDCLSLLTLVPQPVRTQLAHLFPGDKHVGHAGTKGQALRVVGLGGNGTQKRWGLPGGLYGTGDALRSCRILHPHLLAGQEMSRFQPPKCFFRNKLPHH